MIINCTGTGGLAGAGSETTNSLTGVVVSIDGIPAGDAVVRLIPKSYDPVKDHALPDSLTVTTNHTGAYSFRNVDTGAYNIFVQSQTGAARALVVDVHVAMDTFAVPQAKLQTFGAIRVNVPASANRIVGYVYVPGSPLLAFLNNGGMPVILDSVPSGVIPKIVFSSTNTSAITVVRSNVLVKASDTVVAANADWGYSKRLFLNTTASGASIKSSLFNFPVLVRLNKSTFDFSQANISGADLRFTTPDNRQLPYEIERWDESSNEADIWVMVDTIHGGKDRQYIMMYWGNPEASAVSNSALTFDTSRGFQGVWHLSGEGASTVYDATYNHYNGTPLNMSSASAVNGAIGLTRSFDGSSSYIVMKNTVKSRLSFSDSGTYSMSLWVYADTVDSIYHAIAGKGHEQYYMQFKCLKNNKATWEFVNFEALNGWAYSEDSIPPAPGAKQWLFLTGVHSGSKQCFYINGERVVDTSSLMSSTAGRNTGDNFCIGSYGRSVTIPYAQGWSYFRGKIDEVRVSSVALTDDWVRLCYLNQKPVDALVVFDK